jgi:tRNA uridine 5-carboxymethylaminomethyl modification enzyme
MDNFISPISIYAPIRGKVESINPEDAFNKISISPAGIFSLHDDFDYKRLTSLSAEAREKLTKVRPRTIVQASRISGITPSDISILMVYLGR